MVVTIDHSIYLKGFLDVRFEDDIFTKKNGFEVLTSNNKRNRRIVLKSIDSFKNRIHFDIMKNFSSLNFMSIRNVKKMAKNASKYSKNSLIYESKKPRYVKISKSDCGAGNL